MVKLKSRVTQTGTKLCLSTLKDVGMCIYFWYFPMKLWQWRPGQILPDLQVIKRAISIPWSANDELTFSNNLNYGPCCHVNSVLYVHMCFHFTSFGFSLPELLDYYSYLLRFI